jgi:hypothetical protein
VWVSCEWAALRSSVHKGLATLSAKAPLQEGASIGEELRRLRAMDTLHSANAP